MRVEVSPLRELGTDRMHGSMETPREANKKKTPFREVATCSLTFEIRAPATTGQLSPATTTAAAAEAAAAATSTAVPGIRTIGGGVEQNGKA